MLKVLLGVTHIDIDPGCQLEYWGTRARTLTQLTDVTYLDIGPEIIGEATLPGACVRTYVRACEGGCVGRCIRSCVSEWAVAWAGACVRRCSYVRGRVCAAPIFGSALCLAFSGP